MLRKNHITMLVTSHNKEDIEVLSDIVLELKNGKLVKTSNF